MNKELRELAKELYFKNISNEDWRDNFLTKLKEKTVHDKREEGFFCIYCSEFSKKESAFPMKDIVISPKTNRDQIWIVNEHYDGCRGWD